VVVAISLDFSLQGTPAGYNSLRPSSQAFFRTSVGSQKGVHSLMDQFVSRLASGIKAFFNYFEPVILAGDDQ